MVSLPDPLKPVAVGRHKLSRDVMAEHQRARVIEAAIAIFAEKGYPATTVDDLVAAARIGVGTFYAHFDGKEQCLLAAYDRVIERVRGSVGAAAAQGSSWEEQIWAGLRRLLDWIAAEPASARIALIEIQTGGPEALRRYEDELTAAAETLARGRGSRPGRALPETLEQTTVNGIAWLLHRHLALDDATSVPELFDELAELILEPYLGEERARATIAAAAVST